MPDDKQRIDDVNQTELVRFILDIIHRSILHYGLWFAEGAPPDGERAGAGDPGRRPTSAAWTFR